MRTLLRISLLTIVLVVSGAFGVEEAHAQLAGIPTIDGPVNAATLRALGETCKSAEGAILRRGAFSEDAGGSQKDSCVTEDTKVNLSCRYSSTNSTYTNPERCTITYKDVPPPDNTRIIDIDILSTDGDGTGGEVTSEEVANNETENAGSGVCSALDLSACIRGIPGMIISGIGFLFLTLSTIILFLAGTLFNWVVLRTVFQFGQYFGTSEGMLVAWGVMRDIANIGLLFGFILMGVLLILNVEGGGGHGHGGGMSAKKAIPRLIIFAVLLNFSLFATQFVVDISNAFGSTFTTLAGQQECEAGVTGGAGGTSETPAECAVNTGISSKIISAAGIANINDIKEGALNFIDRPYAYATSLIMLSIFVLVTAMVLLAGAIMLIVRVVVLSFLMVTSPVGFAGMVIPGLSSIAHKWWDTLIKQAFFAPVYLLLIFISIKLTEGLMSNSANLTNAILGETGPGTAGNVQVVMIYCLVIGFMIASLISASKFGAMGAKFATSSAAALTVGSAGFVGRRTLGVGSQMAANRIASSSWARNNGFGSRFAYNLATKGANSSFSLRTGLNSAGKSLGVDLGAANKRVTHGIHGIEEEEIKAREKFANDALSQNAAEIAEEKRLKGAKTMTENSKAIEQARWREQKNLEEREAEAAQVSFTALSDARLSEIENARNRNMDQASARANAIEEQKARVEEARRGGKAGQQNAAVIAREESRLAQLNAENRQASDMERGVLQSLEGQHRQALEIERADIEARRRAIREGQRQHEENIQAFDARVKDIDLQISGGERFDPKTGKTVSYSGVSKDAAKRQYANNISHSGLPWPSIGKHVNHEASEKILKKLNRTDNDKLVDAIKDSKGGGGGGGGGHAPAAAPSGGGGGHH